jgi:hypothetical protein
MKPFILCFETHMMTMIFLFKSCNIVAPVLDCSLSALWQELAGAVKKIIDLAT